MNVLQVGDTVECLFPFSGRMQRKEETRYLGSLPPPRMLDIAVQSSVDVMFEEGDPSQCGIWECATPFMLQSLPKLLCWAGRWADLGERVLGSLSFMSQVIPLPVSQQ